ncbi:MAG: hypothetical protein ACK4SO_04785 [Candidatus Kapaibacteriota bacterium]
MEKGRNYRILKPLEKEINDDILFKKNKYQEELLHRKQSLQEIRDRIKLSIDSNDPAFWKTLKAFLGSSENESF